MPSSLPHLLPRRLLALLALSALLAGCASAPKATDAWGVYHAAIADAAVASPAKVLPLQALPPGDTVEMVSWVGSQRAPCEGVPCRYTVSGDRQWLTLAGEVQAQCRQWKLQGDALRERLEQLLGLPPHTPPQWRKGQFVVMQVPRAQISRPCLGSSTDANNTPRCTITPTADGAPELRNFVLRQMGNAYVANNPAGPGYPFTRLGYTYDWHPEAAARGHYGASEFVVDVGTTATVVAQYSTDAYCAAAP